MLCFLPIYMHACISQYVYIYVCINTVRKQSLFISNLQFYNNCILKVTEKALEPNNSVSK